jgi:hypothetical protein
MEKVFNKKHISLAEFMEALEEVRKEFGGDIEVRIQYADEGGYYPGDGYVWGIDTVEKDSYAGRNSDAAKFPYLRLSPQ